MSREEEITEKELQIYYLEYLLQQYPNDTDYQARLRQAVADLQVLERPGKIKWLLKDL